MNRSSRPHRGVDRACRAALTRGVAGLRRVAFWSAVAFPLVYLLALVPGSPVSASGAELVAAVAVHAVALLIGHGHTPTGVAAPPTDRRSTATDDRPTG